MFFRTSTVVFDISSMKNDVNMENVSESCNVGKCALFSVRLWLIHHKEKKIKKSHSTKIYMQLSTFF